MGGELVLCIRCRAAVRVARHDRAARRILEREATFLVGQQVAATGIEEREVGRKKSRHPPNVTALAVVVDVGIGEPPNNFPIRPYFGRVTAIRLSDQRVSVWQPLDGATPR